MAERYFYYDAADYTACEDHMAHALARWHPQVEGMEIDRMIATLEESEILHERNFRKLGTRMGPVEYHCMSAPH